MMTQNQLSTLFITARDALLRDDTDNLRTLVRDHPDLAQARYISKEGPYNGYFHRPTLLHHVAGNPQIQPHPAHDRDLVDILLQAGAELDAVTAAGPDQPTDIG